MSRGPVIPKKSGAGNLSAAHTSRSDRNRSRPMSATSPGVEYLPQTTTEYYSEPVAHQPMPNYSMSYKQPGGLRYEDPHFKRQKPVFVAKLRRDLGARGQLFTDEELSVEPTPLSEYAHNFSGPVGWAEARARKLQEEAALAGKWSARCNFCVCLCYSMWVGVWQSGCLCRVHGD